MTRNLYVGHAPEPVRAAFIEATHDPIGDLLRRRHWRPLRADRGTLSRTSILHGHDARRFLRYVGSTCRVAFFCGCSGSLEAHSRLTGSRVISSCT